MVRDLLVRGMIAGLVAGIACFGVAKVWGEPQVDRAIAFEEAHSGEEAAPPAGHEHEAATPESNSAAAAHDHGGEEEIVSRATQSTTGLLTATAVYGAAMGGLFALAFAFLYGRIGDVGPRVLALLLALAAFVAVYYAPSLKYPSNPPAVGDSETIGYRTGLFLLMMLISLGAMVLAVSLWQRFASQYGELNAALIGVGVFLAIIIAAQIVLPDINEVPSDFPASVLWRFRMASLGMQALLWSTLGLVFGALAERLLRPARAARPRTA